MRRICTIIILSFIFSLSVRAQTEARRDSISIEVKNRLLEIGKEALLDYQKWEAVSTKLSIDDVEWKLNFDQSSFFKLEPYYIGPEEEGLKIGQRIPGALDYTFVDHTRLSNDLVLRTNSFQRSYGVGDATQVDANFIYTPNDRVTITGGAYGGKYRIGVLGATDVRDNFGLNASFRLKLHDNIYFKARGNYSGYTHGGRKYLYTPASQGIIPQTYYGGGMEFKLNDKIGVEGGVIRELNPLNGKWTNRLYVLPVFYKR